MEFGQDGFENSWTHFLVMEFIDGWDLGSAIRELRKLPYEDACTIIRNASSAVQYAHDRQFVHRDIKPHNILLPREGIAKLSDFGLVKYLPDESSLTQTGDKFGTMAYMPPEQFRDAKMSRLSCDIYASR